MSETPASPGADQGPPKPKRSRTPIWSGLRSSFLAGIVVAAPIGITAALIYWFVTGPMEQLDSFVRKLLPNGESFVERVIDAIPGLGVLIAVLALVALGALTKNFIGRSVIRFGETVVDRTPVIRNLYRFFKNVFETALQQSAQSFKEVVLVEYPRKGLWTLAFVVNETGGEVITRLPTPGAHSTIFIPTVPNPTSGFVFFVPQGDLIKLKMSVESAAKIVFSLGLVVPEYDDPADAVKRLEKMAAEASEKKTLLHRLTHFSGHR